MNNTFVRSLLFFTVVCTVLMAACAVPGGATDAVDHPWKTNEIIANVTLFTPDITNHDESYNPDPRGFSAVFDSGDVLHVSYWDTARNDLPRRFNPNGTYLTTIMFLVSAGEARPVPATVKQ